jgi:D-beta-D-heptose 7-phosphate kinase/D-beta-D-heptose 1-phosphate adenosyltransferase
MNIERLEAILGQFVNHRVLVVGDVYLDAMHSGRITEMSLEAPIPVFENAHTSYNPGAAGNVAANISAMGATSLLCGVIGNDANAGILVEECTKRGIDTKGLIGTDSQPTNTYGKFRAGSESYPDQEILRMDTPKQETVSTDVESQIIKFIEDAAPSVHAIVVIDQVSSLITPAILNAVIECAKTHSLLTVADSRSRIGMFHDFDVVVPNEQELGEGLDREVRDTTSRDEAAKQMMGQCKNALVTCGGDGIAVYTESGKCLVPCRTFSEVLDVTGAGDSVTASTTLSLLSDTTFDEAAEIGNAAAGVAVGYVGAVTVSQSEIKKNVAGESMYGQKIQSLEELQTTLKQYQTDGKTVVWTNGCFDILHAGHVTYLQSARKQGDVMVVGLNSDASVQAIKGPERPIVPEDERALIISALECVDHVVVFEDNDTVGLLDFLKPDIYAKGGDYTLDTINQDERKLVEGYGGRIALIPGVDGKSTTSIIQKLSQDS